MAWIVFGTFFLMDAHAPPAIWVAWVAAVAYDFWKELRDARRARR